MERIIKFYNTDKAYGCFSNFYKATFEFGGAKWATSEHYFQAMKFEGTAHFLELSQEPSAMKVANMGRDRTRPLRKDWEDIKDQVMYTAVKEKFDQNIELRNILLSTGNAKLIEHTKNDNYWADGGDGSGQNKLGILLMELRSSYEDFDNEFYLPQWLAYPDKSPYDMFWRMGVGEDYTYKLHKWSEKWGRKAYEEYKKYFAVPDEWK